MFGKSQAIDPLLEIWHRDLITYNNIDNVGTWVWGFVVPGRRET